MTSGSRVCTGGLGYSLECFASQREEACGADTSPQSCLVYGTCQHPDFGKIRGTYTQTVSIPDDPGHSCQDAADAHLAQLSPADRAGVTYVIGPLGGGGESLKEGGFLADAAFFGASPVAAPILPTRPCVIIYSNYPNAAVATGTGPQCGQSITSCAPACVNHQTCQHPDFGMATVTSLVPFFVSGLQGGSCDLAAQNYIFYQLPPHQQGATYTYTSEPYSDGESEGIRCDVTFTYPEYKYGTGPQCGTAVGPCSASSLSPVYKSCRASAHGLAPSDADCGPGFSGTTTVPPNTPQAAVEAQAQAQWAASGTLGSPVYDEPIFCTQCRAPFFLGRTDVQKRVYTAAALFKNNPKLHILAGTAYFLARQNPGMSAANLTTHLNSVSVALNSYAYDPTRDASGPLVRLVIRMLSRAEPGLAASPVARDALRAYSRGLLGTMNTGLSQQQLAESAHEHVGQYGRGEEFILGAWDQLFDTTLGSTALATAVNTGIIGTTLGIHTDTDARSMLDLYRMEPLRTFVINHWQSDGSIEATEAEVRQLVTDASTAGLDVAKQYATVLYTLNAAEQRWRDRTALRPAGAPSALAAASATTLTPEEEFKQILEQAKKDRTRVKDATTGVREGVSGALGLASMLLRGFEQGELAGDIARFSSALNTTLQAIAGYTESSIKIADTLTGALGLGVKGFQVISAAVFTGQMVAAVVQFLSILSGGNQPTPEQLILKEVKELRQFVGEVRVQMLSRFDRIDRKLNFIYAEMMSRFDLVDWQLGLLNQDLQETQSALFNLNSNLNRMERDIFVALEENARQPFRLGVDHYLQWDAYHPSPMPNAPDYTNAEPLFFSWAKTEALGETLAGAYGRDYSDAGILVSLTTHTVAHNINYLAQLPGRWPPLSALSDKRLVSPKDWGNGAEAYARLTEEQAAYAAAQPMTHHGEIITEGEKLDAALRNIGKPLFGALHDRYTGDWDAMKAAINGAESVWRNDPLKKLYGIDLWGGPDQQPSQHALTPGVKEVVRCEGDGKWPDGDGDNAPDQIGLALTVWRYDALRALLIADNLDLEGAQLDVCATTRWQLHSSQPTGLGTYYELKYWLRPTVYVRYRYWDAATSAVKSEFVFAHSFSPTTELVDIVRQDRIPTYNPNATVSPDKALVQNWGAISALPSSNASLLSTTLRDLVRPKVAARLVREQQDFYASIALRVKQPGDALNGYAQRLTGTQLLWKAYVTLGLPLSVEHDDGLRALLYGDDAVMSGWDVDDEDTVDDDLSDLYALFAVTLSPPAENLIIKLDTEVKGRAQRLRALVDAIYDNQASSGGSEASAWTESTLLHLRLSNPH
ncbi:hypothetical protein D7V93_09645 [Corallococcus llansteffanensis]|uniref:Uncharacterized protein n=1 Tax=Corallococcus llansteffanensis TaxID=2316731 RepID=A0A3A8Q3T5_9BACT|nr:hypothetical protein D7V93_09645 [Corallococcus llansteffanensis]